MTEATSSLSQTDLNLAIAHYLGLSLTASDWSASDLVVIDMILQSGLRQFYLPPKIYDDKPAHEWSFLRPIVSLTTVATYATGTVAIANGATTVTLTDGVWPSWTYTHGALVIDTTEYAIASRTDDTHIELSAAWAEDTETVATFSLRHNGNYTLPDDFGGIEGDMTFGPSDNKPNIRHVGEGKIRSLRSATSTRGVPEFFAIRPIATTTLTVGQRFEVQFFPIPNDAYTLEYRKNLLLAKLGSAEYPYGGALHGETIKASCLAAAEDQEEDEKGIKWTKFVERLSASIRLDQVNSTPDYFGYNGDNSDNSSEERLTRHGNNLVTYNGGT